MSKQSRRRSKSVWSRNTAWCPVVWLVWREVYFVVRQKKTKYSPDCAIDFHTKHCSVLIYLHYTYAVHTDNNQSDDLRRHDGVRLIYTLLHKVCEPIVQDKWNRSQTKYVAKISISNWRQFFFLIKRRLSERRRLLCFMCRLACSLYLYLLY